VVGRPNVGKSSLINALVGTKVGIVSDRPQTTRFLVRGILNEPSLQLVFTDTPGLHKPRNVLGQRLNQRVDEAVAGVDVLVLVVDGAAGVGRGDAFVAEREVEPFAGPRIVAVNKVDRLRGRAVVPQLAAAADLAPFDHVLPVSARTGAGVPELSAVLRTLAPEGPPLFPADRASDQSLEQLVADVVREKALALTREEVPHSVAVVTEDVERDEETGFLRVSCTILVERESQKGIVVGRGGRMMKEIGSAARAELETTLGARMHLELRVKVLKDWQRDPRSLDRLGL